MTGITVTRRNGNLLACKSAPAGESERIRHEAQLLKRLQHPGIVQFVDFVEGPSVELYIGFVGPDSWATQPPATSAESIEALAAAASTVADLHKLGVVHGALCPEHVLVAPDKRPVLCGLADATASCDGGRARDLAGLATLIDHLAAACEDKEQRQLGSLARRAERGSVTAQDLTAELDRLHGRPRKRSLSAISASPILKQRIARPSRRASIAAVSVLGIAVLGWIVFKPEGSSTNTAETAAASPTPGGSVPALPTPAGPVPESPASGGRETLETGPSASAPGSTSSGAGSWSTSSGPTSSGPGSGPTSSEPVDAPQISQTPGAGSATPNTAFNTPSNSNAEVDEASRAVIDHQGRRYGVGQLGDKTLIGDWNCNGTPTLALLQPSTGTVAVFASWPAPSQRLQADFVTVIEGATDLRNDPSGGCDQLRVAYPGGSILIEPEFS